MELEGLSDEQLMTRYKDGDVRAFEVLLGRHSKPVYNFVLRSLGNPQTAEDLMQEVFLRIVKGAATYQHRAKFTTWLYTIARNLCVDTIRRQKHRRTFSLDTPIGENPADGTMVDRVADKVPGEDRQVMDGQFRDSLERALGRLNPDQREVFVLREFQNLPFAEIAEIVNCPVNTVKSRMRYALEGLRAALTEMGVTYP